MRDVGDLFFSPAFSMPNKIKLIASCATELIKLAKYDRQTSEFRLYKRYVKYLSKL